MDIQLAKNHAAGYKWAKLAAGFLGRPKVIILWRVSSTRVTLIIGMITDYSSLPRSTVAVIFTTEALKHRKTNPGYYFNISGKLF